MEIKKEMNGTELVIVPVGNIDSSTAPILSEAVMSGIDEGADSLLLDFENVEYISSAGIRVIVAAVKKLKGKGTVCVSNAIPDVKEIFDLVGLDEIIGIK